MHTWRRLPLIFIVFTILVSCSNSRNSIPIAIDQFEEGIISKKVERILFHSDGPIEIKYIDKPELYQITSDTLLAKEVRKHVFKILDTHGDEGIIFEEHVRFIDNFF